MNTSIQPVPSADPFLAGAIDAARWIEASAALSADGRVWPADPDNPASVDTTLYHGTPGPVLFFLGLHRITGNQHHLDLAREASDLLLAKATRDDHGLRWRQAEHRVRPGLLVAQTGYMQGASGIGMWLLHMSAFERGMALRAMTLPDNPFPY